VQREPATTAQRVGAVLAFVEACLFVFVAALHFGFEWTIADTTFSAPFGYPMGFLEGLLAIALLASVILPGGGMVRAGRVLAAQILTVIGLFVGHLGLMADPTRAMARNELFYAVILGLALTSVVLVASPMYQRRRLAR
jgi:hypothetical protein